MLKFSDISIPYSRSDLLSVRDLYRLSGPKRSIMASTKKLAKSLRSSDLGLHDVTDHKKLAINKDSENSLLSKSRGQSAIL